MSVQPVIVRSNTVTITVKEALSAKLSVNKTSAIVGELISFTIEASGGEPNYIAQIVDAGSGKVLQTTSAFSSSTTISLKFLTSGTYNIYAQVADSRQRTVKSNTVTITIGLPKITANLSVDRAYVTVNEPLRFTVTITGGIGPYTIRIKDANTGQVLATQTA